MIRNILLYLILTLTVASCSSCTKTGSVTADPEDEGTPVTWKEYDTYGFKLLVSDEYEWDAEKDMAFKYIGKALEYFTYMLDEEILSQMQAVPVIIADDEEDFSHIADSLVLENMVSSYYENRADLGTFLLGDLARFWYGHSATQYVRESVEGVCGDASPEDYFVNATMAYWGTSKSFPNNYHQLMNEDPEGFKVMEKIWGSRSLKDFTMKEIRGFRVMYPNKYAQDEYLDAALTNLDKDLKFILENVPVQFTDVFKRKILWLDYTTDGAACYHDSMDWLLGNGYIKEKHRSVEINNMKHYVEWTAANQPLMVLHEFAHLFHYCSYRGSQLILSAYENAVNTKIYESVDYFDGKNITKQRAYALNNEMEYFSEMTEAWFGRNDYYPFTRADLETHDPKGYELMQTVWDSDNFTE